MPGKKFHHSSPAFIEMDLFNPWINIQITLLSTVLNPQLQKFCVISYVMKICNERDKINGLVQDCSNSSALAVELLQSCTEPSKFYFRLQSFH